jgi:hypothetical protein
MPSKCGLKIIQNNDKKTVIVTELYQDNPGTSVTYAGGSLIKQICDAKQINPTQLIYIECNPDTNSKLSFYDEEMFQVLFDINDAGEFTNLKYKQLTQEEIKEMC